LKTRAQTHTVKLLKRKWLSKKTFEIFITLPFFGKAPENISLA